MRLLLVGAGGHARVVCDAMKAAGFDLAAYADPQPSAWLDAPHCASDDAAAALPLEIGVALGLGGVSPARLRARLALLVHFLDAGRAAPSIVHPRASVAGDAVVGRGVQVMCGAIVQAGAVLGDAVIVNTGAIVEHGSIVAEGSHVAPGAIVLGNVRIGGCAMIGAGAVVLPGTTVSDGTLVPAGAVHGPARSGGGLRSARRRTRNTSRV